MAAYEKQGESDEWYTPAYIFDAHGVHFDLDVACPPEGPRYVPAARYFREGGIDRDWLGFVWMNPPFGHQPHKRQWLRKFFEHGKGIALLPDAILFVSPKVKFERPDGSVSKSPGTGTTLMAAGAKAVSALHNATELGVVFTQKSSSAA